MSTGCDDEEDRKYRNMSSSDAVKEKSSRTNSKSLYAQEMLSLRNRSKSPSPYNKGLNNNGIDYSSIYGSLKKHNKAPGLTKNVRSMHSSSAERSPSPNAYRRKSSEKRRRSKRDLGRHRKKSSTHSSRSSSRSSVHVDTTRSRNRSRSSSLSRGISPAHSSKKSNYEDIVTNSTFHANNSDDIFRAKLQMLCNVGLIKDDERSQVTQDFVESVWLEFSKLKGAERFMVNFNNCRQSERQKSRSKSSMSRDSNDSHDGQFRKNSRRKKASRDKRTRDKRETERVITGHKDERPFMKVTELLSQNNIYSKTSNFADADNNSSEYVKYPMKRSKDSEEKRAAKKVCESLRRQDMQIELLERELEKIEQAIEKQFKPGRDRDEATLKEQIRLGRELKLQIDQVEKERLILRDKLTTDEMSPSISNKFLSPRKDMVKNSEMERFEYYDGGHHWCRMCDESCNTIIQFLSHLHTQEHRQRASAYGERPWMKLRDNSGNFSPSEKKTATPFLGSEFVVPVVGFFCKLCMEFTGDIADCEEHLTGDHHNINYRIHLKSNKTYEQKLQLEKSNSSKATVKDKRFMQEQNVKSLRATSSRGPNSSSKDREKRSVSKASRVRPDALDGDLSEYYEDAFGLNSLVESDFRPQNSNKSKKGFVGKVADGKPNFTVTINRDEKRSHSREQDSSGLSGDEKTQKMTSKLKKFKQTSDDIERRAKSTSSDADPKTDQKSCREKKHYSSSRSSSRSRRRSRSLKGRSSKISSNKSKERGNRNRSPVHNRRNGSGKYQRKDSRDDSGGDLERCRKRMRSKSNSSRSRSRSDRRKYTKQDRLSSKGRSSSMSLESKESGDEKGDLKLGTALNQVKNESNANFSIKKISLALTESDQYFTETDKVKTKGRGFMEIKAEPKIEPKMDESAAGKKESISFSISKEDKLKKQIMETKIFSQIHKSKALSKTTSADSNSCKFKSLTGKKPSTSVTHTSVTPAVTSMANDLSTCPVASNSTFLHPEALAGFTMPVPSSTPMFTNKGFVSTMIPVNYQQVTIPPVQSLKPEYEESDPPPPGME